MSVTISGGRGDDETGIASAPDEAESGASATMRSWKRSFTDRSSILVGNVDVNESVFSIPASLTITGGSDSTSINRLARATLLDQNGDPLSGTLQIEDGGGAVGSSGGSYDVVATTDPPPGVYSTEPDSSRFGSLDVSFAPSISGLTADLGSFQTISNDFGVTQYGEITGTVTNAIGDVVGGVPVYASSASTETLSDGSYSILGPSGTVSLTSLEGTSTKQTTISVGGSGTINFQYSGVRVRVNRPNGEPAGNVPVNLSYTNEKKRTGGGGEVLFPELELNLSDGQVSILETITEDVDTFGEGGITQVTISLDGAFEGIVSDSEANEPANNVDIRAIVGSSAFITLSGDGGDYVTGVVTQDFPVEVEVLASDSDSRYGSRSRTVTIEKGDIVNIDFDLPVLRVPTEAL